MEAMTTFKLVVMYGLEVVVVTLVGITVLAGLYQLVRDQLRALTHFASERRLAAVSFKKDTRSLWEDREGWDNGYQLSGR